MPTRGQGRRTRPWCSVRMLASSERDATITVRGRTQALHAVDVRAEVEGVVQATPFRQGRQGRRPATCFARSRSTIAAPRSRRRRPWSRRPAKELRSRAGSCSSMASAPRRSWRRPKPRYAGRAGRREHDGDPARRQHAHPRAVRRLCRRPLCRMSAITCAPATSARWLIAPEPFLAVGDGVRAGSRPDRRWAIRRPRRWSPVRPFRARCASWPTAPMPTTRTFRVEVELPNADDKLRDGVSADIHIPVRQREGAAHLAGHSGAG